MGLLGRYAVLVFIAIIGMIIPNSAFAATDGFTDFFDIDNWTFSTQGNGFLAEAEEEVVLLVGSDESETCGGEEEEEDLVCNTDFTITIPENGYVKFFWEYLTVDGPEFDRFGIVINREFTELTDSEGDTEQDGFAVVPVNKGDDFAFRIDATDDVSGIGAIVAFDFMFVPENEGAYISSASGGGEDIDSGAVGFANLDDGEVTQIGDQVGSGVSGLTFDSNGDLFASAVFGGGSTGEFYQIDPITGDAEFLGDFEVEKVTSGSPDVKIKDLATQPGSDVIFGVGEVVEGTPVDCSSFNALFTIDKRNAIVSCVGNFEIDGIEEASFDGLAFAPDGTLFTTGRGWDGETTVEFLASINLDASFAGFFLEVEERLTGLGIRQDGTFFATTSEGDSLHTIDLESGETPLVAGEDNSLADVTFFPFATRGGGGGSSAVGLSGSPTIGVDANGRQIVSCGVAFDSQCFTISAPFHEEFKLFEMMSGTHTISITMWCPKGVNDCAYAAIGVMPYSASMDNPTWKIEAHKDFEGNITLVKTDPEGFLGEVTVTSQIEGTFWVSSFTIEFKNKDTDPMMFGVQARTQSGNVWNWYLNEGVEFKDSDAYPSIDTVYNDLLEIDSLCVDEDPTYRYSCAFDKVRERAIQVAEETLRQMTNK